jgi:3-isopropylmalate dehydrogenase
MLLSDGLGLHEEAAVVTRAIERTLSSGLRTADVMSASGRLVSTAEFANAVAGAIRQ